MDCITCVLMGMCILCEPGFGSRKMSRPLTTQEVEMSVENLVRRFESSAVVQKTREFATARRVSYESRQSFIPDPKFAHFGIGKRGRPKMFGYRYQSHAIHNLLAKRSPPDVDLMTALGNQGLQIQETEDFSAENGSNAGQYDTQTNPEYTPKISDYAQTVPEYAQTVPEFSETVQEYTQTSPEYAQANPKYIFTQTIPKYTQPNPEYVQDSTRVFHPPVSPPNPSRMGVIPKGLKMQVSGDVLSRARMFARKKSIAEVEMKPVHMSRGRKGLDPYLLRFGIGR